MAGRGEVVEKIVASDLCSGCGACAAIAPLKVSFGIDDSGFLRPRQTAPLPRKAARQIWDICPGRAQVAPSEHSDPLWGGYLAMSEGWSTDAELRHAGASGGALSGMCAWLLESGQVDGVLQVVADASSPAANKCVVSRSKADVLAAAASRYAPSAPLLEVADLLQTQERFAFVGKPCDVAALRRWAVLDPKVSETFPVMLSFFCAGVPSLLGAATIARDLGVVEDDIATFRYRGNGWPGQTEVVSLSGTRHVMRYQDSWGGILSKHVQPRCKICADGTGLAADLGFADAWETDAAGYPLFEEQDGRSLIVARTGLGVDMLEEARRAGVIHTAPFAVERLEAMQPGQVRRRRELLGRLIGRVLAGLPVPQYRGMRVWAGAAQAPAWRTFRAALGMARRSLIRRAAAK